MPIDEDDDILEGGYSDPDSGVVFDEYGNVVDDPEWDDDPFEIPEEGSERDGVEGEYWYPGPDQHMTREGCVALAAAYTDDELARGLQVYQLIECQKHGEKIKPKVPTFGLGRTGTLVAVGLGVAVLLMLADRRR
jgi:hypothetical protein